MEAHRPPRIPRPVPAPRCESPAIGELGHVLGGIEQISARAALVREFWDGPGAVSPMRELGSDGTTILTFLHRSEHASAILLLVNRLTEGADLARSEMTRLAGTDIWHLSYALEPDWRGSYGFVVHEGSAPAPWAGADPPDQPTLRELFGRAALDPRNPATCPTRAGHPLSVAEGPEAPPQLWQWTPPGPDGPRALQETRGPDGRRCWLFDGVDDDDPAAAGGSSSRTEAPPLWLILDGEVWAERFDLGAALRSLIRSGALPPLRAALIDSGGIAERWNDLTDGTDFIDVLAARYLPWAERRFGETFAASRVGVAGQSLGGLTALRCGIEHPRVFGRVIAQSASLWLEPPSLDHLRSQASGEQRFRIEVGTHEWILREPNRRLHAELAALGARAELVEYAGGHDYACWRSGLLDGLAALSGS